MDCTGGATELTVSSTSWIRFEETAALGTIDSVKVAITTDIRIWMR